MRKPVLLDHNIAHVDLTILATQVRPFESREKSRESHPKVHLVDQTSLILLTIIIVARKRNTFNFLNSIY